MLTRRNTLKLLTGSVALSAATNASWSWAQADSQSGNALKIPELMNGTAEGDSLHFALKMQKGMSSFLPGINTPTLGFNGDYLGPTLHFKRDSNIAVEFLNALGEDTAVHWHGLHIPPSEDGGPHHIFSTGETWNPAFKIMQKAGTFWYHSHMLHKTGKQAYHGLAGLIIIDDQESQALPLPSQYGVDDIPLILQDRSFNADGTFRYMQSYDSTVKGMRGDILLANGTADAYFDASTSKIRFRIVNASNGRLFNIAFSDDRPFQQIASDGGLLEAPLSMNRLIVAPAERVEIVVDVSDSKEITLVSLPVDVNYPVYNGAMSRMVRELNIEHFDILQIRPQASLNDSASIPAQLTQIERLQESDAVLTRRFDLNMGSGPRGGEDLGGGSGMRNGSGGGFGGGAFAINGRTMDMGYNNEKVKLGDTEIWRIQNLTPLNHPFHMHGLQFQVLDRNEEAPPANELGLKDTVLVRPGEIVRIIMHFEHFSDTEIPYMYHCHNLEHEDRGMMGQFLVLPA